MAKYIIFFLVPASISFFLTPLIRLLAKKANILDIPSERKIHKNPTPLLGGVPIYFAFNLSILLGYFLNNTYIYEFLFSKWQMFFICQVIILLVGIYDDIKKLSPTIKFLFQIFIGILLVFSGFEIKSITNIFTGNTIQLGVVSIPITILWIVGIMNALNLVDGLDGLAAGTSFIVSVTIFAIAFFNQNIEIALVALILSGSILGFLRYNFHPAKIFLGDSGSLYLGFLLAVFSIEGSYKGATLVAVLTPILALGLPIIDTLLSMIRRFLKSINMVDYPSENGKFKAVFVKGFSMFEADKDHIHHRLLKLGFSHKKAVIVLYGLCVLLCFFAIFTVAFQDINSSLFLGAIVVAFFIGIRSLNYEEFKILENGLLLPLFDYPVINKRVFQAFFDIFCVSLSYYLSFVLVFGHFTNSEKNLFIQTLPLILAVKLITFFVSGIYKSFWKYSSVEDILTMGKAIFLSSLGLILILTLFFRISSFGGFIFVLIDFYLMATFVISYRVAYKVINSIYIRNFNSRGKKVIIYGAGHKGSTALKEIRHSRSYFFSPVGFIDDDKAKKGSVIHNCPVLGSIDDFNEIVKKNEISEIIVSTDKIEKEKIKQLLELCKLKGIVMRQFEFRFYEFP